MVFIEVFLRFPQIDEYQSIFLEQQSNVSTRDASELVISRGFLEFGPSKKGFYSF